MILFVFEGKQSEPKLFEALKELFFPKRTEQFICTYNSNIYSLYSKLVEHDIFKENNIESSGRTLSVLNSILQKNGDNTLSNIIESDVSEIFLFFDYDFHDSRHTLEENNLHLNEMLSYFNDETENGKLYINYPMIESIKYHKELPDLKYYEYTIKRSECKQFKSIAHNFSHYESLDYILLTLSSNASENKRNEQYKKAKSNWKYLVDMNVGKANYICNNVNRLPSNKREIEQSSIFKNQLIKYVETENCSVAILNAFPLFIYEYFDTEKLFNQQK